MIAYQWAVARRFRLGGMRCLGWVYPLDVVVVRCELGHGHHGRCLAPRYRAQAIARLAHPCRA